MVGGVAAELAERLNASVTFIRVLIVIVSWLWFWPVVGIYAAAALLLPHAGRRVPGWLNFVGLARIGILIALVFAVPVLSLDKTGLFGQGPTVWIPCAGALLAGVVALLTSGRPDSDCDEASHRPVVIALIPAAVLAVTIGAGMLLFPEARWELVLDLGLIPLGVAVGVFGRRVGRVAPLIAAVILSVFAIVLASSGARLQGGIGNTLARPTGLVSLRHPYRRAIGDLTLDLSGLHGRVGAVTNVDASVGIGSLMITLPNNAEGTVEVRIGIGALAAVSYGPNGEHSGFDLHHTVRIYPQSYPRSARSRLHVRLSAQVGRGCVTILQVPGESYSSSGCL